MIITLIIIIVMMMMMMIRMMKMMMIRLMMINLYDCSDSEGGVGGEKSLLFNFQPCDW